MGCCGKKLIILTVVFILLSRDRRRVRSDGLSLYSVRSMYIIRDLSGDGTIRLFLGPFLVFV